MLKPTKSIWLMHAEADHRADRKAILQGLAMIAIYTALVAWITSLFIN